MPTALGQIAVIVLGGLLGLAWLTKDEAPATHRPIGAGISHRVAIACLLLFFALLALLPLLAAGGNGLIAMVDGYYRAGSLVFGGGHVVLPLLQAETVETGLVGRDAFLAGYGAAQAVPGPLFTFAAYLGAVQSVPPNGVTGAAVALAAIFLPAALLVVGALPFWDRLRRSTRARQAMKGVNAAVVGLLAAALYDPVFSEGVTSPATMAIAAAAFTALAAWNLPAWVVVIAAGLAGFMLP
jgi:chromate transporter